jgi:adenylate cyclase
MTMQEWTKEKESLLEEIEDLKMLYETIAEHSTAIENELELKNEEISALINQLKKYLSPQLFQSIVGGKKEVSLSYKRKFLSIFFSDIVGFTEISDRTDPEILSELLNSYLNDMANIAHAFGGTIDKFIGDALMIFFGDPEYVNDQKHAVDCCGMALAMQEKIKEIDKSWRQRGITQGLKVRMGIHSGYCTVGNFGSENRMDYTIIGGNVNIASRLENLATPGGIYISAITANLLTSDFKTIYKQTTQVKGIHYPIEVYELQANSQENNLVVNSLLTLSDNALSLQNIAIETHSADWTQVSEVKDTLSKALEWIDNNLKRIENKAHEE